MNLRGAGRPALRLLAASGLVMALSGIGVANAWPGGHPALRQKAVSAPAPITLLPNGGMSLPSSVLCSDKTSLAADPNNGNVYLGCGYLGNASVAVFDRQGHFLQDWPADSRITANRSGPRLAVGPDGLVYVAPQADADTIRVFKPDGTLVRQFGSGSHISGDIGGIDVDQAGNVFVTSRCVPNAGVKDDQVVRFKAQGEVTARWSPLPGQCGSFASSLRGVTVAPDGSVYVLTGDAKHILVHLDANGHPLAAPDLRVVLGTTDFSPDATDIHMADGLLYIAGILPVSY